MLKILNQDIIFQLTHLFEQKQKIARQKRRVTIILVSMVVLFGLTSLPHNIVNLITEFDSEYDVMVLPDGTDMTYILNLFSHWYVTNRIKGS